jgi:hypothetical protein
MAAGALAGGAAFSALAAYSHPGKSSSPPGSSVADKGGTGAGASHVDGSAGAVAAGGTGSGGSGSAGQPPGGVAQGAGTQGQGTQGQGGATQGLAPPAEVPQTVQAPPVVSSGGS